MYKTIMYQYFSEESSQAVEANKSWPFRIKLTPDSLRWDSVKISPSDEFAEYIVAKLDDSSQKFLDARRPIEIELIDVDIHETYEVNLVKKEAFWFEPFPDLVVRKKKTSSCYKLSAKKEYYSSNNMNVMESARSEFYYSVEPFKHIVKNRNLSYGNEIGLRWSGSTTTIKYDFSVLNATQRLDLGILVEAGSLEIKAENP